MNQNKSYVSEVISKSKDTQQFRSNRHNVFGNGEFMPGMDYPDLFLKLENSSWMKRIKNGNEVDKEIRDKPQG